jgi:hypothetical protein
MAGIRKMKTAKVLHCWIEETQYRALVEISQSQGTTLGDEVRSAIWDSLSLLEDKGVLDGDTGDHYVHDAVKAALVVRDEMLFGAGDE